MTILPSDAAHPSREFECPQDIENLDSEATSYPSTNLSAFTSDRETPEAPTHKVFRIQELVETVLEYLPGRYTILCQRVCRQWRNTITYRATFQALTWRRPRACTTTDAHFSENLVPVFALGLQQCQDQLIRDLQFARTNPQSTTLCLLCYILGLHRLRLERDKISHQHNATHSTFTRTILTFAAIASAHARVLRPQQTSPQCDNIEPSGPAYCSVCRFWHGQLRVENLHPLLQWLSTEPPVPVCISGRGGSVFILFQRLLIYMDPDRVSLFTTKIEGVQEAMRRYERESDMLMTPVCTLLLVGLFKIGMVENKDGLSLKDAVDLMLD